MPIYSSPQSPPTATATTPGAAPLWPPPLTDSRTLTIDAMSGPYNASGDSRTTTVATLAAALDTHVVLAADIGFRAGHGIWVAGYNPEDPEYVGTVVSVSPDGLTVECSPAFSVRLAPTVEVRHDDTAAIQAAITAAGTAGGGAILGRGYSRINGPIQDAAGANAILVLPSIFYGANMVPIDITLRGPSNPSYNDQAPSVGGWIIQTNKKATGTAAMLSGYCATSTPWGTKTACFLTLEDITFRTYRNPEINGVNGLNIGRVQGRGQVVIDNGYGEIPSNDRFALQVSASSSVPPCSWQNLTVEGFYRGVVSGERFHCTYLYSSFCKYPLVVAGWDSSIERMVVDVATACVSGEGTIKIGLLASDQADALIADAGNLLIGDITYSKLSGTQAIIGGSNVRITEIGGGFGTFGTDKTTWDLAGLACDSKGGFELTVEGITAVNNLHQISLRVNGSVSNIAITGWYNNTNLASGALVTNAGMGSLFMSINGAGGTVGNSWTINLRCPAARSGKQRQIHLDASAYSNPTTGGNSVALCKYIATYEGVDEIASVGLISSVASSMGAASTYKLRRL